MVLGFVIYRVELELSSDKKQKPTFVHIASQGAEEKHEFKYGKYLSNKDLIELYVGHLPESALKIGELKPKTFLMGRLKESPHKYISFYHQEVEEFLAIGLFDLVEDVEMYEDIFHKLAEKLQVSFQKIMQGNLKDIDFVTKVRKEIEHELKFTLFQISRMGRLEKIQKLALIYANQERVRTLEILREGPVSRKALYHELEKTRENPNLGIILQPFLELNIVRRDWAKGIQKEEKQIGEGEYFFLVKDIALVRKVPPKIVDDIKKHPALQEAFDQKLTEFYESYNPFVDISNEGRILAPLLLQPDLFDFLGYIKERILPADKIPKITSEFVKLEVVLGDLQDAGLITLIKDGSGDEWVVPVAEITAMSIFPDYLVTKIRERWTDELETINEDDVNSPLTQEVAIQGLRLLENTYHEKLEF